MNIYENCPVLENEKFILRLTEQKDCDDLLKVYSDKNALPFFNSDNCDGDNFYYENPFHRIERRLRKYPAAAQHFLHTGSDKRYDAIQRLRLFIAAFDIHSQNSHAVKRILGSPQAPATERWMWSLWSGSRLLPAYDLPG